MTDGNGTTTNRDAGVDGTLMGRGHLQAGPLPSVCVLVMALGERALSGGSRH